MSDVIFQYAVAGVGGFFILFVFAIIVVVRLLYDLNTMKYELEISKINCQKDLNRLEDKLNAMLKERNTYTEKEIDKLEKIQQNLIKIIDGKLSDISDGISRNKVLKG